MTKRRPFAHAKRRYDITDCLDEEQMKKLIDVMNEPAEKDTISYEEFTEMFARWHTK